MRKDQNTEISNITSYWSTTMEPDVEMASRRRCTDCLVSPTWRRAGVPHEPFESARLPQAGSVSLRRGRLKARRLQCAVDASDNLIPTTPILISTNPVLCGSSATRFDSGRPLAG